ncbi:hypothetical protein NPIL_459851 [Nephila pilipes]|uniref:Uncharacterized protein n=1 Tax=Nephila pilipes TaxID=299642 RepID=A0A8X6QRZ4_NEPPI|nr:hypothetical protein NPIL_459851 [Nephila pilipes]
MCSIYRKLLLPRATQPASNLMSERWRKALSLRKLSVQRRNGKLITPETQKTTPLITIPWGQKSPQVQQTQPRGKRDSLKWPQVTTPGNKVQDTDLRARDFSFFSSSSSCWLINVMEKKWLW